MLGKIEINANTEEEGIDRDFQITFSPFKELKVYHRCYRASLPSVCKHYNYKMSFPTNLHFVFGPVTTFSMEPSFLLVLIERFPIVIDYFSAVLFGIDFLSSVTFLDSFLVYLHSFQLNEPF